MRIDQLFGKPVFSDRGLQETSVEKEVLIPERSDSAGTHRGTEDLICDSITTVERERAPVYAHPRNPCVIPFTGLSLSGHIRTQCREGRIGAVLPRLPYAYLRLCRSS